jgi:chemosensory pili system protein ChpB (putative protein-glutamate methylesterase)
LAKLRIGIIVDTELKQRDLSYLVAQVGHQLASSTVLSDGPIAPVDQSIDAWVVDLVDAGDANALEGKHPSVISALDELLEQSEIPVIFNEDVEFEEGSISHSNWGRRMLQRLERLSGDVNLQQTSSASEVWVLAASTGGPAAVKEFMMHLPGALNIAFVYVQHIDKAQVEPLIKMMSKAGRYPSFLATQGTVLINNTLTLISAKSSITIHENGTLVVGKDGWNGFYAPSIDQVAANVARVYRKRCGIIIFSGMGDDGAASCKLIKQQGGRVWAQTPSNCVIDSMPNCAIATNTVDLVGTPEELAGAFARLKTQKQTIAL